MEGNDYRQLIAERVKSAGRLIKTASMQTWHGVVYFSRYPVPHYTRWGFYPQAILVFGAYCWWKIAMPIFGLSAVFPGVAIGFLAFAAAIMAVRGPHFSHTEEVVWILIAFVLFYFEIRSIYKDRSDHDIEMANLRREESEARIKEAEAFQKEEHAFDGLFRQNKELFNETSGGDSYLYFEIGDVGVAGIDLPGVKKDDIVGNASPTFVGKYPLSVVHVSIWCAATGWLPIFKYEMMRPNEIGRQMYAPRLKFLNDPTRKSRCVMWMNAPNGYTSQSVWVMKWKDKWVWTSRVFKKEKLFKVFSGPGFPKEQLSPNWYQQDKVSMQP